MALAPYAITVPRTEVAVDATARTGEFTVDVTNVQASLDRVVLDIVAVTPVPSPANPPPGSAVPTWFAVENHLRDIPAGGSEQYLVTATVPGSVAPGSYLMKPVAYSADHPPDDTTVTGPIMTLVIPAPPPAVKVPWYRRWWPWWLVAAVAAVLLVVAVVVVIVVLTGASKVTVPDETGKTLSAAQSDLQAHHLATGAITQQGDTTHAKDTVLKQSPAANTKAAKNSAVALTVALNVVVPDVSGGTVLSATNTLQGLGLMVNPTQTQQASTAPPGQVLGTSPAAKTPVLPNTTITLIVAVPPPVTVPRVIDQTETNALTMLNNVGLHGFVVNPANCTPTLFLSCVVINQSPIPGQQVAQGSTVELSVIPQFGSPLVQSPTKAVSP
jgi:beta-lactam-binding protein with PASTA domain